MSAPVKLYTPELLGCAVRLAEYPLVDDFPLRGEARSATCGSSLMIGLACDGRGLVRKVGIKAHACAVGQAAAAIFAGGAIGMDEQAIRHSAAQLRDWLIVPQAPAPCWPDMELLDAARAYPARHPAVMLPWDAALQALSKAGNGS